MNTNNQEDEDIDESYFFLAAQVQNNVVVGLNAMDMLDNQKIDHRSWRMK